MKMKRLTIIIITLTLVCFTSLLAPGGSCFAGANQQKKCPVMGYPINKDVYVDYQGKRIYFCCPSCPDRFRQEPDRAMKKLEEQGVAIEKAPGSDES
jgi:YHS domain-containing protein